MFLSFIYPSFLSLLYPSSPPWIYPYFNPSFHLSINHPPNIYSHIYIFQLSLHLLSKCSIHPFFINPFYLILFNNISIQPFFAIFIHKYILPSIMFLFFNSIIFSSFSILPAFYYASIFVHFFLYFPFYSFHHQSIHYVFLSSIYQYILSDILSILSDFSMPSLHLRKTQFLDKILTVSFSENVIVYIVLFCTVVSCVPPGALWPLHPKYGCGSDCRQTAWCGYGAAGILPPWLGNLQRLVLTWSGLHHPRPLCHGGRSRMSR